MKIELERDKRRSDPIRTGGVSYPVNRGGFVIVVDGKQWGLTKQQTHGCHGSTHELYQSLTNGGIDAVFEKPTAKGRNGRHVRVWSDKQYLRHDVKPGDTPKTLVERVTAMVAAAISAGNLRDPTVVAAEAHKINERLRQEQARELQRAEDAWRKKADEIIGPAVHALTASVTADLRGRIVAGLKWARSQ